jgi:hypothetical protein
MSKYSNISVHLLQQDKTKPHTVHFSEIERIIGATLPESARLYQAWWANQSGAGHTQATSWCSVDWNTKNVDLENEQVTFIHVSEKMKKNEQKRINNNSASTNLTIEEAKNQLAVTFGIKPDQIEITIRG